MKTFIAALVFTAIATAAIAQMPPLMPRTMTLKNSNGEMIATVTTSDGHTFYLRDAKREFIGTIIVNEDRTRTYFDPDGKIVEKFSIGDVNLPNE